MKKLDTHTVLEIIKMIENGISSSTKEADMFLHREDMQDHWNFHTGRADSLEKLSNHLQEYIEGEISAMENSTQE